VNELAPVKGMSLDLPSHLTHEQWLKEAAQWRLMGSVVNWVQADLARRAADELDLSWPEISHELQRDSQRLQNMASTARAFSPEQRNPVLSLDWHLEVKSLPEPERGHLLAAAAHYYETGGKGVTQWIRDRKKGQKLLPKPDAEVVGLTVDIPQELVALIEAATTEPPSKWVLRVVRERLGVPA
tara:strand:- start:4048 stop:4599 length:552 start_codon:yes stop_codon:yes gene_type:complete